MKMLEKYNRKKIINIIHYWYNYKYEMIIIWVSLLFLLLLSVFNFFLLTVKSNCKVESFLFCVSLQYWDPGNIEGTAFFCNFGILYGI